MNIDVVVLSYNRLELTIQTIESINQQKDISPLIWLVDQGSDTECLIPLRALADNTPNIALIENGYNMGVAKGRNIGMRPGKSEVVVSLDNDAVFADDTTLQRLVERFAGDASLGAIGFKIQDYFTGQYDRGSWAYPRSLFDRRNETFLTTRFCGAGHALRRSALEKTELYDEALFFYWEELDLSYQLIESGYKVIYDPEFVVRHKVSSEQRTHWAGKRYYYLVRNAVYLDYKYFRSYKRVLMLSSGYLLKGAYNRTLKQAISAVVDAWKMTRRQALPKPLGAEARRYITEHDFKHRGSVWQRIRQEVLERLT